VIVVGSEEYEGKRKSAPKFTFKKMETWQKCGEGGGVLGEKQVRTRKIQQGKLMVRCEKLEDRRPDIALEKEEWLD